MRSLLIFFNKKIAVHCLMWALVAVLSSCNSASVSQQPTQADAGQIQQLQDKMFVKDKPESHFDEIRDYVFEQYPDMPQDVVSLIQNTRPKFLKNESKMEYCFFWVLPDGSIVEVVTTPPPLCDPINIRHGKRIQYE